MILEVDVFRKARKEYEDKYTAERNVQLLIEIYEKAKQEVEIEN